MESLFWTIVKTTSAAALGYSVWYLVDWFIVGPLRSPLRLLPGPPSKGFFGTHLHLVMGWVLSLCRPTQAYVYRRASVLKVQPLFPIS